MTTEALKLARDGDADATAAALRLWAGIGRDLGGQAERWRVAGAALDMIGVHVGDTVDIPDYALRESVGRLGHYLRNTSSAAGLASVEAASPLGGSVSYLSEFHGSAIRKSGVMGLLAPWRVHRAGVI